MPQLEPEQAQTHGDNQPPTQDTGNDTQEPSDTAEDEPESPILQRDPIATDRALQLLTAGEVSLRGRMPYSSNATFLVDVCHNGLAAQAIYKPVRGERPLWDFPTGLAHREVGAFLMAEALGWEVVPPTVMRADLPFDAGSLQLFMPADFSEHYFTLVSEPRHQHAMQRICALDVVINNTDRKSGHCLLGTDDKIWAIDNGLSFHHEFKLRTVIWDFEGENLPDTILRDLQAVCAAGLPIALAETLTPLERAATETRLKALTEAGHFPVDETGGRRWPWPLV